MKEEYLSFFKERVKKNKLQQLTYLSLNSAGNNQYLLPDGHLNIEGNKEAYKQILRYLIVNNMIPCMHY